MKNAAAAARMAMAKTHRLIISIPPRKPLPSTRACMAVSLPFSLDPLRLVLYEPGRQLPGVIKEEIPGKPRGSFSANFSPTKKRLVGRRR
uniref:Uncharacterized protein n=1 Tax=Arundo donax TaxID=35708 RepID=A0A0A9H806_ARUDO